MSRKIKIDVTRKVINAAGPTALSCVINVAARNVKMRDYVVDGAGWTVLNLRRKSDNMRLVPLELPKEAQDAINLFDTGRKNEIVPFSFELTIPETTEERLAQFRKDVE